MEELAQAAFASSAAARPPRALCLPQIYELGPIEMFSLQADALVHEDDAARAILSRDHGYAIVLMTEGRARAQHYGHRASLARGDFVLIDGAAPFGFAFADSGEILVFVWRNILDRVQNNAALGIPGTRVRVTGVVQEFRSNREIVPTLPYDIVVLP